MQWGPQVTGYLIGVAIGVGAGIVAAILIYALFTQAFDVKVIVGLVGPMAAVLIGQQWLRDLISDMSKDEIVIGAVSAFLVIILYPVLILMLRIGREIGQASPPRQRKPRGG